MEPQTKPKGKPTAEEIKALQAEAAARKAAKPPKTVVAQVSKKDKKAQEQQALKQACIDAGVLPFYSHTVSKIVEEGGNPKHACFSNFFFARFTIDYKSHTIEWATVEFLFHWRKAMLFGDMEIATKILEMNEDLKKIGEITPSEFTKIQQVLRGLGQKVKGYVDADWAGVRYGVVVEGVLAKFQQNPELKEILLSTGELVLCEAKKGEKIWGIDIDVTDPKVANQANWNGENLLGKALIEVRTTLRSL